MVQWGLLFLGRKFTMSNTTSSKRLTKKRGATASHTTPSANEGKRQKQEKVDSSTCAATDPISGPSVTVKPASAVLDKSFYDQECATLAKKLLGKTLVRIVPETRERISGKIVETEAYLGTIDKAAHSYKGKNTPKTQAMFMPPGTAYVYNIYGMYCCMNISSKGEGAAVLLRSLEPVEGISSMEKQRSKGSKNPEKKMKEKDLCNGPSKLCQALQITKDSINKCDMASTCGCTDGIWLEDGEDIPEEKMIISKRINIGYAEDWVDKPLRFYILGNTSVSVRDKNEEKARQNK